MLMRKQKFKDKGKNENNCFKGKNIFFFMKRNNEIKKKKNENIILTKCIKTLFSDPIVVLYTDENYICTGTLTGKVFLYKIKKKENKAVNTDISLNDENVDNEKENEEKITFENISYDKINENENEKKNKCYIISMFRNNSIEYIYIDKKYIYIYYENNIDVFSINTYKFIKKIHLEIKNRKQVIFYKNFILFNQTKDLSIYDVTNNFMNYFLKKFFKNVIIFDFNLNYLLCYKNYFGECLIRVLQISNDMNKYSHELIFCVDFSSSSKFITHGKILDDERIIVAKNGNRLIIFDFKKAIDVYRIKKFKTKILDIYKSKQNMLFTLLEKKIHIFNLSTLSFFKNIYLPNGLFYFKWPYYIKYEKNKIIFSYDGGISYIDYNIES